MKVFTEFTTGAQTTNRRANVNAQNEGAKIGEELKAENSALLTSRCPSQGF